MGSLHLPSMWHEWTLAEVLFGGQQIPGLDQASCGQAEQGRGQQAEWPNGSSRCPAGLIGTLVTGNLVLYSAVAASTQGSCGGEGMGGSPLSAK